MPLTIAHATTDSLPRVVVATAGTSTLDVLLPFRVDIDDPARTVTGWELDVEVDGRSWGSRVRSRRLRAGLAGALRERMARTGVFAFDHLPYYAGLHDDDIRTGRAVYLECRMPGVRPGATVTYTLSVTVSGGAGSEVLTSGPRTLHAVDPRFTRKEVRRIHSPGTFQAGRAWVLHHRRTPGFDQLRIDVADLGADGPPERADLVVQVGDTVIDLRAGRYPTVPLVDVAADSVTFAVPAAGEALPPVTVRYRGGDAVAVDLADRVDVGTARVMFVNFAIQGLNDLFATPDDDYQPPRSYTRLTMRDEAASYSSRPGSEENSVGDGYAFTIDAHRRYRIPQMWAMNGGLLDLLAHDCPDDLDALRRRRAAPACSCPSSRVTAPTASPTTRPTRTSTPSASAPRILEQVLGAAAARLLPRLSGSTTGKRQRRGGTAARRAWSTSWSTPVPSRARCPTGRSRHPATRRSPTRNRRWGRCTTGAG